APRPLGSRVGPARCPCIDPRPDRTRLPAVPLGLKAGGFARSPLFAAIVLVATSLCVIVPVLNDSGDISGSFGQLLISAASIADFGSIILLSLFFSGKATSTGGTLILLGAFGLVVLLVGLAIARALLIPIGMIFQGHVPLDPSPRARTAIASSARRLRGAG